MTENILTIFLISDGTGETADQMIKAALVQYMRTGLKIIRYKNIRTEIQVRTIFEEAHAIKAIIVYTVVSETLRKFIDVTGQQTGVSIVDLLGPLLEKLSVHLKRDPQSQPGLFHQVNENYFKRIEAIEFTVKHDDGKYADSLDRADIVLVGLSRTSKTPLSIFLSYKGWKVANVPLVKDIDPPKELFQTDQRKVVALVIDPETLVKIRRERLVKMGENPGGDYASLNHVMAEIEFCKELYRKNRRWPIFDITGKALEETASEVERVIKSAMPEKWGHIN